MWKQKFFEGYYSKNINGTYINKVCIPYKNKHMPNKLYKYTKAKYAKTILNKNLVYLPSINELNDPYEGHIFVNKSLLSKTVTRQLMNTDEIITKDLSEQIIEKIVEKEIEKVVSNTMEEYKSNLSIICLSEDNSSNPMWAHYGDNHYGICIEYNLKDTNEEYFKNFCYPIQYVNKEETSEHLNQDPYIVQSDLTLYEPVLKKSSDWEYENEWRVIIDKTRQNILDRIQDEIIKENNNLKIKEYLKFIEPVGVYLGIRTEEKCENELIELCKHKEINVYKMKIDKSNYNIYPDKILTFK